MLITRLGVFSLIFFAVTILGSLVLYPGFWAPTLAFYIALIAWWSYSRTVIVNITTKQLISLTAVLVLNFLILFRFFPDNVLDIVAAAILAPIFEEYLFRGFLFDAVTGGAKKKIFITAILFALWHIKNAFSGIPDTNFILEIIQAALIIGPFFGWLRYRYQSLFPSILVHSIYNTMASFALPLTLPLILVIWLGLFLLGKKPRYRF